MFRVSKNFYLGVSPSFNYIEGRDFSNIDYLRGQKTRYINTGLAAFLLYDSRDFIPNAWRGIYVKLEQRIFPGFFGNDGAFSRTEFQGNAYHRGMEGRRAGIRSARDVQLR